MDWINSKEELLRVAKGCYNCDDGLFKWLKVKLTIDYIEMIKQQAACAPARSFIITQLASQSALKSSQSFLPNMPQPINNNITISFIIPKISFIKVV